MAKIHTAPENETRTSADSPSNEVSRAEGTGGNGVAGGNSVGSEGGASESSADIAKKVDAETKELEGKRLTINGN